MLRDGLGLPETRGMTLRIKPPKDIERTSPLLLNYLNHRLQMDVEQYKPNFLRRRIGARMLALGLDSHADYLEHLRRNPEEPEALHRALMIHHSGFMRDLESFQALREEVLDPLIAHRRAARRREVAVWSAGCASGEEIYSVAILLAELLGPELPRWQVSLYGTDISAYALKRARRGQYASGRLDGLSDERVARYFQRQGEAFTVSPSIRRMITWALEDVRLPTRLSQTFDVILCRNVVIYYVSDQQIRIVRHLTDRLRTQGYLMLGMSEGLPATFNTEFTAHVPPRRIFQRIGMNEDST